MRVKKLADKTGLKQLEKALDQLTLQLVTLRDRQCVQCGSKEITTGHVFSRRVRAVRWDHRNIYAQCPFCNSAHENNRQPYYNWVKEHIGEPAFDELKLEWNRQKKLYSYDLEIMKQELENLLEKDAKFFCTLTYEHHKYMHGRCVYCGEIEHLNEQENNKESENCISV